MQSSGTDLGNCVFCAGRHQGMYLGCGEKHMFVQALTTGAVGGMLAKPTDGHVEKAPSFAGILLPWGIMNWVGLSLAAGHR